MLLKVCSNGAVVLPSTHGAKSKSSCLLKSPERMFLVAHTDCCKVKRAYCPCLQLKAGEDKLPPDTGVGTAQQCCVYILPEVANLVPTL